MRSSLLFLLVLIASTATCGAQEIPPVKDNVRGFMRQKLEHSQKLLEAIVMEDSAGIAREAQKLSLLSQESNWRVLQTEDYLQQSIEFRRATDSITVAGRNKNVDAAALGYVDMTLSCVKCHKYVRGVRMAKK